MRIIKPSVELITPINGEIVIKRLEQCGRVCYKSENSITADSANQFLKGIIKRGHESVLEHCSLTVKFIVDRGISHEIVRHRIAAYSQESTRYCNYSNDRFNNEITVIEPFFLTPGTKGYECWKDSCNKAEQAYFELLEYGCTPQEARSVLPHSLKTEIVTTYNIREWRHFLRLRCGLDAHPQMREVATQLLDRLRQEMPVLFEDVFDGVYGRYLK